MASILQNISKRDSDRDLSGKGLMLNVGPFRANISIGFKAVRDEFRQIYKDYPIEQAPAISNYHLSVYGKNFFRRWVRKQATIETLMNDKFIPLPAALGMVSVEMGLNWQIALSCRNYVLFHAGVVERDGVGLIMPAMSGSGKSTLSAGLAYDGWRFLADEFGMLDTQNGQLVPYPRPISLKNQSIAVMKDWVGNEAAFSRIYQGTPKGNICYLSPPAESIERMAQTVTPRVIILPVFNKDATPEIKPITKTMAFFRLVMSSANYGEMGEMAFKAITRIVDECAVCEIHYSSLEEAIRLVNEFVTDNVRS